MGTRERPDGFEEREREPMQEQEPSSKSDVCKTCNGTGLREFGDEGAPCFSCGGSKVEPQSPVSAPEKCPNCGGLGTKESCHHCRGTGIKPDSAQPTPSDLKTEDALALASYYLIATDESRKEMWHSDLKKVCEALIEMAQGQASSAKEIAEIKEIAQRCANRECEEIAKRLKVMAERDGMREALKAWAVWDKSEDHTLLAVARDKAVKALAPPQEAGKCKKCAGDGRYLAETIFTHGRNVIVECPDCKGSGKVEP